MTTPSPPYSLRQAVSTELARAIAVDDAAALLFTQVGVIFDLSDDHPFVAAEHERWRRAVEAGELCFACSAAEPIGFSALARAGERAYLEQLSVHPDHGRRGVGSLLLEAAFARSRTRGDRELWLTTYAHVPWNKPYYERHGFVAVPEGQCNAALRAILEEQRAYLPFPQQRIAMVRALS